MQKYSRGRRGAPAKGVGRATGARVQIPPSAFRALRALKKESKDSKKNLLTIHKGYDRVYRLSAKS